jgi:hypothetical protein
MRENALSAAPVDEAPQINRPRSRMGDWAQRRAKNLGIPLEDLQTRDVLAAAKAKYPGPDCLDPIEIHDFFASELPAERLRHLSDCAMCAALVEVANPPEAFFDEVLKPLVLEPTERQARQNSRFLPVVSTGGLVVLTCFSAGALWIYYGQDALFSELFKQQALKTLLQVGVCTALLVFAAVFASRIILSHQARLLGGVAILGVFFCAVTVCSFRDLSTIVTQHAELTATQMELMSKLAQAGARTSVAQEVPDPLPGRLVAAKADTKSFDVVWDKSEEPNTSNKSRDPQLATIYACRLQSISGSPVCATAGMNLKVSASAADPRIKNGEEVLALMPYRTMMVSKMFPLETPNK